MTFPLPCPVCSSPQVAAGLVVPSWSRAGRTSVKRKVFCAFFTGCTHAIAHGRWNIVELPDAEAVVISWNAAAEQQLACLTAGWTEAQRTAHRTALGYPAAAPEITL